jgi:hypothetical protein
MTENSPHEQTCVNVRAVLPRNFTDKNTPVTNVKELKPTIDKICIDCFMEELANIWK